MLRSILCTLGLFLTTSFAFAAEPIAPAAPPEPEGMIKLFNGKDLTGWDGDTRLWAAKDGAIHGETTPEKQTKGNTFLIYVGDQDKPVEFKDFELRLSFRIDHGNAGVQYRSTHLVENKNNKWVVKGYQAEVENTPGKVGFLYHESGRGWLVNVGDKMVISEDGKKEVAGKLGNKDEIAKTYKKSDWNDYVIICKGNHVQHFLNGIQTIDLIDNDQKAAPKSGIIALQIHAGPPMWVEYKDIRLKKYE